MDVKELLKKGYIVLDGAMGTMLQKKGMKMGVVPETLGITKPDWIIDIHKQYIEAGSDIVYANPHEQNPSCMLRGCLLLICNPSILDAPVPFCYGLSFLVNRGNHEQADQTYK